MNLVNEMFYYYKARQSLRHNATLFCLFSFLLWLLFASTYRQVLPLEVVDRSTILPVVHMVWVGLKPFSPITLATIDSLTRHRPGVRLKMHIPVEDEIPPDVYTVRKSVVMRQINFFKEKGFNIEPVFYENVTSLIGGTVLDSLGLQQRHIGGLYNSSTDRAHASHASDIIREVVVYKEGGSYIDTDVVQLKDMGPLQDLLTPMFMTTDEKEHVLNTRAPKQPVLNGATFAATPGHPFLALVLSHVRQLIKRKGADCWFPWKIGLDSYCGWGHLGPLAFTDVNREWCSVNVNSLPVVLNQEDLARRNKQPVLLRATPSSVPYFIISPAIVSPVHWGERSYFQSENAAVLNQPEKLKTFAEKVKEISNAYQIHIFNPHKYQWLDMLQKPSKYPLARYVHLLSCNHFCNVTKFKKFYKNGFNGS